MTSLKEYLSFGADEAILLDALQKSADSKSQDWQERVYVGIVPIGTPVDDGTTWGSIDKTVKRIVLLRQYQHSFGTRYFCEIESGKSWHTGNYNATLSPWDCEMLLKESK